MPLSNNILGLLDQNESKPVKASNVVVNVDVSPSSLVRKLSKIVFDEMIRLSETTAVSEVESLGSEGILKYLKTLVYLRVNRVNGSLKGALSKYNSAYRHLAVPVFMYQLLISIGEVWEDVYNITFHPVYSIEADDLLALEELIQISDLMTRLPQLAIVNGLPNDEGGELPFMAMQHVNGRVTSYRQDHPVYGFLASFFAQQEFNEITGSMHRIHYGNSDDYEMMMYSLMRKFSVGGGHD